MTTPCVYCGDKKTNTKDHVPGKGFFPQPRPSDLITVACCRKCNVDHGYDEEFFAATFLFSDAASTKTGKELWDSKFSRGWRRNSGLRAALQKRMSRIPVFSPKGIYLQNRLAIELDHERLDSVVMRCIRGLYFFEFGEILHNQTEMQVANLLTPQSQKAMEEQAKSAQPGKRDWPGVFEYRVAKCHEVDQGSMWLVRFYGMVCYWAVTSPFDFKGESGTI